jgi:predicted dienelactone hydrolase
LLRRIPSLVAALYLTVARVQAAGLRLIGLVVIGGNPDFRARLAYMCLPETTTRKCEQIRDNKVPAEPLVHDPRIKAAAIVDSIFAVLFSRDGLKGVTIPVQLWRSALGGDGIVPEAVAALEKASLVFCFDPPSFDRTSFHKEFDAEVLAFFANTSPKPRTLARACDN